MHIIILRYYASVAMMEGKIGKGRWRKGGGDKGFGNKEGKQNYQILIPALLPCFKWKKKKICPFPSKFSYTN